jgi:peptidoglycan/LPS O-acetylase OafA/YrhL
VLASHTSAVPIPLGTAGVWLFFVLSAFLLTKPFVSADDRNISASVTSFRGCFRFYIRRFFRIIPMYAFYVVSFGFLFANSQFIVNNLLEFRGQGHLWTINQEMFFYAIMPVVLSLIRPFRRSQILCAVFLTCLAALSDSYLTVNLIKIPAMSSYTAFYLSLFLLGMAAAFAQPIIGDLVRGWRLGRRAAGTISLAVLIFAIAPHVLAGYVAPFDKNPLEVHRPLGMGCMFAPFLIWISVCPNNWLTEILSFKPLRMIGEAGFSFYLLHVAVLVAFNGAIPAGWKAFTAAAIVTAICAQITYQIIEKRFIRWGSNLALVVPASAPAPQGARLREAVP